VDRQAIARDSRRRQARDALDFELQREQAIEDQIAIAIGDVDGHEVDAAAFEKMSPEDAEIVKTEFNPLPFDAEDEPGYIERDDLIDLDDEYDPLAAHAEELARLTDELAQCRRRQEAFKAYIAALGD
jgi:hypothetical protein